MLHCSNDLNRQKTRIESLDLVIDVSILVCTHNRSPVAEQTVVALLRLVDRVQNVELIVVDNASTDDTAVRIQQYHSVVYRYEEQLGLSHARNRALREARGEWVIFVDDDVFPEDGWLTAYLDFIESAPEVCGFFRWSSEAIFRKRTSGNATGWYSLHAGSLGAL